MGEQTGREWLFSFGYGQGHDDKFVRIAAANGVEARREMVRRYGRRWGFQYEAYEEPDLLAVGMTELRARDG